MIKLARLPLLFFSLAFGYYHAALAVFNLQSFDQVWAAIPAIALYLVAISWAIVARNGLVLKDPPAALAIIAAGTIPLFGVIAIGPEIESPYQTWYVVGIANLMSVLAIRQRLRLAWAGMVIMILEFVFWRGFETLFASGIIGAFLILAAAHAVSRVLASSDKAATELINRALQEDSNRELESEVRKIATSRISETLTAVLPLLRLIKEKKGRLSKADAKQLLLTEAAIRDQIRGRGFTSKKLAAAIFEARSRGVEVQLLDDGGVETAASQNRKAVVDQLIGNLQKVKSGKVVIRSAPGETWTVTMVAIRPGAEMPDVFLRI